jgi:hypothetical protein
MSTRNAGMKTLKISLRCTTLGPATSELAPPAWQKLAHLPSYGSFSLAMIFLQWRATKSAT